MENSVFVSLYEGKLSHVIATCLVCRKALLIVINSNSSYSSIFIEHSAVYVLMNCKQVLASLYSLVLKTPKFHRKQKGIIILTL